MTSLWSWERDTNPTDPGDGKAGTSNLLLAHTLTLVDVASTVLMSAHDVAIRENKLLWPRNFELPQPVDAWRKANEIADAEEEESLRNYNSKSEEPHGRY
jgi:hypothetical protein